VGKKKIQEAYINFNHLLQIGSNEPYFWQKAKDIAQEDYSPSKEDIIRAKLKTLGILDFEFEYQESKFNLVDVGGQRSERRKWIHCFDNVSSVIYLSAIDEYDGKTLFEDDKASRFYESLTLFEKLSASPYFEDIPFILFLNKIDLFEKKKFNISLLAKRSHRTMILLKRIKIVKIKLKPKKGYCS